MSAPLRWGYLGASRIGRRSLAPAMRAAGQTLHAVAARDLGRAEAFAGEFGFRRAYAGYEAVLDDRDVDAVYIALTNDRHVSWAVAALAAGKHVLCEKPLALNAHEVAQMIVAAKASGRLLAEAFGYRFNPQILRLREVLASGVLGDLVSAHVSFGATLPQEDFRWSAALGGGAMYDLGCYCVDLLRLVAGAEPARVAAFRQMRGDVDAATAGLLEFPSGMLGHFSCSFAAARSQHLAVAGRDGALTLDWPIAPREPRVTLRVSDRVETFGPGDPYRGMVAHFAAAARGEVPPAYPLSYSLAQARALDALFEAGRTRAVVVLPTERKEGVLF